MRIVTAGMLGLMMVTLVACGDGFTADRNVEGADGRTYVCNPDSDEREQAQEQLNNQGYRFTLGEFERAWETDRDAAQLFFQAGVVEMVDLEYSEALPETIYGLAFVRDWGTLMDLALRCGYEVERGWGPAESTFRQAMVIGKPEIARVMIQHGVDVNRMREDTGYKGSASPLHVAVIWDHSEVVRLLLEEGADPNLEAEDGRTPMDLAEITGNQEVKALLQEHGAESKNTVRKFEG